MIHISENCEIGHMDPVHTAHTASPTSRWWVAHTKSRNEKALAHVLGNWNIDYFLPLSERTRVTRGRKIRRHVPLFPGYVFFAGDETARYEVMTTNRVAKVIFVDDQARLAAELAQLRKAMESGARLLPHPYLKTNTRCRIISGAFEGIEGMFQRRKNGTHLILQVEALGQGVALEIDAGMVEPVS